MIVSGVKQCLILKARKQIEKVKVNKWRKTKRSSATSENHNLGLHIYKGNMEEEHKLTY